MAFEFPVPKGSLPIAVYVKGARHSFIDPATDPPMPIKPFAAFTSQADRDGAIRSGSMFNARSIETLDRSGAVSVKIEGNAGPEGTIKLDSGLPQGIILASDGLKGLEIDGTKSISGGGLSKFGEKDLSNRGIDLSLAVRKFATSDDTVMVQVVVDASNRRFGLLSDAAAGADRSKPPVLIDEHGAPYSPIGFFYKDAASTDIYFNPQSPIQSIDGDPLPGVSKSKPDQQLILLFRVSRGVKITMFAIGEKVVAEFKPALDATR